MRLIGKEAKKPQNRMEEPAVPVRKQKYHKIRMLHTANIFNVIFTFFTFVTLSTVISLYCLNLIADPSAVE